jgi:hypothetical protein
MKPFTSNYVRTIENALGHFSLAPQVSGRIPGVAFPLPKAIAEDEIEVTLVEEHFINMSWSVDVVKLDPPSGTKSPYRLIFNNISNFPSPFER